MTTCVTWSTGRRPLTAELSIEGLKLQGGVDWQRDFVEIRWADTPNYPRDHPLVYALGASRGEAHNIGLMTWQGKHGGDLPDVWFCVDDDIVPCRGMFARMVALLEADPNIYLLGAWNDAAERKDDGSYFGQARVLAGEVVQYGTDFAVGGAVQAIPRRTLDEVGMYDPEMVWLEDSDMTARVRQHGKEACIARTVYAVVLNDDGIDPNYRQEMTDIFFAKRKEKLGW
jgi:hypothetical protein